MKKKFDKIEKNEDVKTSKRGGSRKGSKAGGSTKQGKVNFQTTNINAAYQVANAANFSFANVVGSALKGFGDGEYVGKDPLQRTFGEYTVPGVMAIELHPCIGTATTPSSAINVAANNIYTWVRHANSGHSNYDPADLMLYILAVSNAHLFHTFCVRLYGCLQQYRMYNNYYPSGILRAMGVDSPQQWYGVMPQFRNWMWTYQAKLNTRVIPHMEYIDTLSMYFRYIYKDAESEKAQVELFMPTGFYKNDVDEDKVGKLTFKPLPRSLTLQSLMEYGNELLDAIYHDEDTGIMSGDILKAYGEGGLYVPPLFEKEVAEDYFVEPEFNLVAQDIIRNTVCVGTLVDVDITQSKTVGSSNLKFTPEIELIHDVKQNPLTNGGEYYYQKHPLVHGLYAVCDEERPSPERVMNMTMFMPAVTYPKGVSDSLTLWLEEAGLCIATRARMYAYKVNDRGKMVMSAHGVEYASRVPYSITDDTGKANTATLSLKQMSYLQSFSFHIPVVLAYSYKYAVTGKWTLDIIPFRDWDSYTHLDADQLAPLHRARVLNAFGIRA